MTPSRPPAWHKAVQQVEITDGTILIGSDAHYWPGKPRSTAHSAMVRLAGELKPRAIVLNGDVMDFPTISKHPSIGWESRPDPVDEIRAAQERLAELEGFPAQLYWTAGNHDLRFESNLAKVAPQYAEITGFHLHDHFPAWCPCWMLEINGAVMVKHRWNGGVHATYNNTLKSGRSIVTGHLHSAQVTAFTDYNGTRWGVDTGTLAVPYDDQFIHYTESGPLNWRSAVAVLTFWRCQLLTPELLLVIDEAARTTTFRGQVYVEAE